MIEVIFATLLILTTLLCFIGYWTDQSYLIMLGYTFMFIAGIALWTEGIAYDTGANITTNGSHTFIQDNYTVYTNNRFGFYLAFVSAAAFVVTIWRWKKFND